VKTPEPISTLEELEMMAKMNLEELYAYYLKRKEEFLSKHLRREDVLGK
jgi:hypothetical protein